MAERLAQFGAVELGALLQKVKGFWGSEVWLSLGGLHTHFFLDTHDTPGKFVDVFSIEKGDISYWKVACFRRFV